VTAIDFDGDALKNALENAGLNNVSTGLQLALATLEQLAPREFDLILANINRNVLLKYAALFPGYLRAGAKLILSGFLLTDDLTVVQQYRQKGYRLISKHVKKEWLALVFEFKAKSK
jgi:ribosomal protein L11 methyltransferase